MLCTWELLFDFFFRILTALQERKREAEKAASRTEDWSQKQAVSVGKREWKGFWDSESPGLLRYACSHGTVETVKYFTTRLVSPTTRYILIHYALKLHVSRSLITLYLLPSILVIKRGFGIGLAANACKLLCVHTYLVLFNEWQ